MAGMYTRTYVWDPNVNYDTSYDHRGRTLPSHPLFWETQFWRAESPHPRWKTSLLAYSVYLRYTKVSRGQCSIHDVLAAKGASRFKPRVWVGLQLSQGQTQSVPVNRRTCRTKSRWFPHVGILEPNLKALGEALGSSKCCPPRADKTCISMVWVT